MSNTNIRTIKLGTPREIKIKNCPNLETLTVESIANLNSMVVSNDSGNANPVSLAASALSTNDASRAFYLMVKSPSGEKAVTKNEITALARLVDKYSQDSNISASVYSPVVSAGDLAKLERFNDFHIRYDLAGMSFADPEVERVLLASTNPKIDKNGDGIITLDEARSVNTIPYFSRNTLIETFEEFRFFTGVTTIGNQNFFTYCSNLKKLCLPPSIISLGQRIFTYTNMESLVILSETPPSSWNTNANYHMFFAATIPDIYVPDASVSLYEEAWPLYASKIKPLSSYTGEL